jgi:protocatechuate 3,4-dioxygenase beta subunit
MIRTEESEMTDKPGYRRPQEGTQPEYLHPTYQSTNLRSPSKPLVFLPHSLSEITGPTIGAERVADKDNDLTAQHDGEPLGERIIIHGRVLDENGLPVPGILVEIWQANAAGRYNHARDLHDAPLDPNFTGTGRTVTDADGWYQFQTIKPGAYPWGNHHNAWRPAHIHFSLFGPSILTRLVTQMYFPGDPLLAYDPIYNCVPTPGQGTLIAAFDLEKPFRPTPSAIAGTSSCAAATPRRWRNKMTLTATTSHTVGPYYHIGLTWLNRENLTVEQTLGERVAITGQVSMATATWSTTRCWKSGRPTPPASTPPGRRAGQTAGPELRRFWPGAGGCRRALPFHHDQTGHGRRPEGHDPGAAPGGAGVCPWLGQALADADLLRRRAGERQ